MRATLPKTLRMLPCACKQVDALADALQAVSENMKLKYQIKHLKRAVVEGDEKLAQLGNGGL